MHGRRLFITLGFLLSACAACAQRLPFTVYTTAHGLINNRCHTVRQDRLGYIWAGTDHGIVRFDGRAFRHYPSPAGAFRASPSAFVDRGTVVFGINGTGYARCLGDSVQFVQSKGAPVGSVIGVTPHPREPGYLLSDLTNGLRHMRTDGSVRDWTPRFPGWEFSCLDVYTDSRRNIWLSTDRGLIFFPGGDLSRPERYTAFGDRYVSIIREGANGRLYAGCADGLYRLPPVRGTALPAVPGELLTGTAHISGIAFLRDGSIWASSGAAGVVRYAGGHTTTYGLSAGLPASSAWEITADREGNIWLPTENGLARLSHPELTLYDYSAARYNAIKSGLVWNDSLLLYSNGEQLFSLSAKGVTHQLPGFTSIPAYRTERALRTPGGELWLSASDEQKGGSFRDRTFATRLTAGGLAPLRPLESLPGGPQEVLQMRGWAAVGDQLWVISDTGLLRYANGRFAPDSVVGWDGRLASPVYVCAGVDGAVWILDRGVSAIRCRVVRDAQGAHLEVVSCLTPKNLHNRKFRLVYTDSGGWLWMGGEQGVCACQPQKSGRGYLVVPFGLAEGSTSSDWITSFAEDSHGDVWIGTAGGLDKARKIPGKTHIEKGFYRSELCGAYIFFVRAFGNKIAVGSTSCLAVIDLPHNTPAELQPLVYLSGLKVLGKSRDSLLQTRGTAVLGADDNSLTFSFLGLSFRDEKGIRYRYKLEGLDELWSGTTAEASITYSRVPPGRYTFLVEAQSATSMWSARPARFSFVILQPIYTRWWFIAAVVLLVAAALYGLYRYRLAQVLAIQRIRSKISKDLHDDIGATVSSIGILASIANKDALKEEKRHQYLNTISDQSRYVAETLSDIVWAINPSNDSLEKLFARVLRYATELFEARDIEYEVTAPPEALRGLSLPMESRQHLYLIIKEVVNNLVKYSSASHASISVVRDGSVLRIRIADDGRGFDPEATTGNGIPNMRKRAEALHGALSIESRGGGDGTRVALEIPLKGAARMM